MANGLFRTTRPPFIRMLVPFPHVCRQTTTSTSKSSSDLLTMATAQQLKGDIPKAIDLAQQALLIQQKQDNSRNEHAEFYDTTLFIGKLFQLQGNLEQAEVQFRESLRYASQVGERGRRDKYVAISHLATVQRLQQKYAEAELNYLTALSGLEIEVGWKDGFTNHTSMELVRLYRETYEEQKGVDTLQYMRKMLARALEEGDIIKNQNDPRLVQLYGEEAEIHYALGNRSDALRLWTEVVNRLPGNSPVAREAFMRLVEIEDGDDDHHHANDDNGNRIV